MITDLSTFKYFERNSNNLLDLHEENTQAGSNVNTESLFLFKSSIMRCK